jgi:hypothetical protein
MTLVEDIASALHDFRNLRAYRFDSSSEDQICIIPGGGRAVQTFSDVDIEFPRVQIQVRDRDLATAEARVLAIKEILHNSTNVDNTVIIHWDGRHPDYWLDDNGLNVFSIEFIVTRV